VHNGAVTSTRGLRADAGGVRLTARDVAGLMWCGEMYGASADLLADVLGASADVVRQLHVRWRRAGLAETGRLGPGPVWCWLTRAGLDACGLPYAAYRPPLGRLAHVHAVGAVRHALADARQRRGIERVILQSTPAGLPLYERMGFRTVSRVAVYSS